MEAVRQSQLPPTPMGWKIWFAFCALLGAGVLALLAWLAVAAIGWLNRH